MTSHVAIHEVEGDSHLDTSSESSGADANEAIAAAGMQVAAYNSQQDNFIAVLNNTVWPTETWHSSVSHSCARV